MKDNGMAGPKAKQKTQISSEISLRKCLVIFCLLILRIKTKIKTQEKRQKSHGNKIRHESSIIMEMEIN